MMNLSRLVNKLDCSKIIIQTHDNPDPDALSSAYGLQNLLKDQGIETTICYCGEISNTSTVSMLDKFEIEVTRVNRGDKLPYPALLVDVQKGNSNITPITEEVIGCIDHHRIMKKSRYKYQDIRISGACASLIISYYYDNDIAIPEKVASALCYGIKMDTMDFTRGTHAFDTIMFSYAFAFASPDDISSMYHNVIATNDLKAYNAAIEALEFYRGVGITYIPFECSDALVAMISDFVLRLKEINVVIVFGLRSDGIKISVRSERTNANASMMVIEALKGIGHGGGHRAMAGGFIPLINADQKIDESHEMVITAFKPVLDKIDQRRTPRD